ncbi:MAG: hypothetical protein IT200_12690 [Thermoleophilia bacterium]|nr:hypothetical protein [Thermoleophilia bacterium]
MADVTVLWAGKHLSSSEEATARRAAELMRRLGSDTADHLERFLPERVGEWTPDELELGAHVGPWMGFGAEPGPA